MAAITRYNNVNNIQCLEADDMSYVMPASRICFPIGFKSVNGLAVCHRSCQLYTVSSVLVRRWILTGCRTVDLLDSRVGYRVGLRSDGQSQSEHSILVNLSQRRLYLFEFGLGAGVRRTPLSLKIGADHGHEKRRDCICDVRRTCAVVHSVHDNLQVIACSSSARQPAASEATACCQ